MTKQEKKQLPKGCSIAFYITFAIVLVFLFVKFIIWLKEPVDPTKNDFSKQWSTMTYVQRDSFLIKSIEKKSFINATDVEYAICEAIKKECTNPQTVKFTVYPSIYNGFANISEPDSAWIYVLFKGTAKNDFAIEKAFYGHVTYLYKPKTNSLEVKQWNMDPQN